MLFKKYHIMIFKDRESGVRNLRFRGWAGLLLVLLLVALTVMNVYLWGFYTKATVLEHQLEEAQRVAQEQNSQMLGLSVQLDELAVNLHRVQKFDARLKVLMNINQGPDEAMASDMEAAQQPTTSGGPQVLLQHRELFTRHAFSLVNELNSQVVLEEVTQQDILHFMQENKEVMLATPSIWPARGRLTSGFGYRRSPFGGGSGRMHRGLDIANKVGTPIIAPAKGVVTFAGWDNAYGNAILIDHGNNVVTRYAHLQSVNVTVGKQVQRGEVIGAMGNTGRSTGPHLHYEVQVAGVPVNPMRYILN